MKLHRVDILVSWTQLVVMVIVLPTERRTYASPDLLQMQYAYTNAPSREAINLPISSRGGGAGGASECWTSVRCKNTRRMPICGTDGITYTSKCELKKLRKCEGRNVAIHKVGRCPSARDARTPTKCLEQRRQALFRPAGGPGRQGAAAGVYVPECAADGTFSPVQCHKVAGVCWCVTPDGKPVPDTSVEVLTIQCGDKGLKPKSCTTPDRVKFNQNLVTIFSEEYDRDPATKNSNRAISHETRVVSWKFAQLDEDNDGLLRRGDIRILKKLLKKAVKPRKCAKSFDAYCDLDQDRRISRREWSVCLGADISELDKPRKKGSGKVCTLYDRTTFNQQLIDSFTSEHQKSMTTTAQTPTATLSQSETLLDTPERRAITWKFKDLDKDNDGRLRRDEIRPLKTHVKENFKPKSCAKSLDAHCDLNNDQFITANEWSVCLGVDSNNGRNNNKGLPGTSTGGILSENTGNRNNGNTNGGPNRDQAKQSLLDIISRLKQTPAVKHTTKDTQVVNDGQHRGTERSSSQDDFMLEGGCLKARTHFLELHQDDPDAHIFVPECLADGKYRKEQCHNATGFCWCVDQKSGKPIPTTSTRNVMPNCTNVKIREFKGCSYPQRRLFLTTLLDRLTTEMIDAANNASHQSHMPVLDPNLSLEERAVRWKLRLLDKNNDLLLDKNELEHFKKDIRMKKDLRKCSRNFLRFCDENSDTIISLEEWVDCTGINEQHRNLPLHTETKGINPFTQYLKGGQ